MFQNLTIDQLSKNLWGGSLTNFKHNMLEHSVELTIEVIDSNTKHNYELKFLQILKLEIYYEHPDISWDYVELTEIEAVKSNNTYNIKCDFWSSAGMEISCQKIMVNGFLLKT
jgi:hypothetical protein